MRSIPAMRNPPSSVVFNLPEDETLVAVEGNPTPVPPIAPEGTPQCQSQDRSSGESAAGNLYAKDKSKGQE
jgi:hypothetical protein